MACSIFLFNKKGWGLCWEIAYQLFLSKLMFTRYVGDYICSRQVREYYIKVWDTWPKSRHTDENKMFHYAPVSQMKTPHDDFFLKQDYYVYVCENEIYEWFFLLILWCNTSRFKLARESHERGEIVRWEYTLSHAGRGGGQSELCPERREALVFLSCTERCCKCPWTAVSHSVTHLWSLLMWKLLEGGRQAAWSQNGDPFKF